MTKDLLDLRLKRKPSEAVVFYIIYFTASLAIIIFFSSLAWVVLNGSEVDRGTLNFIGSTVATVYTVVLIALILAKKQIYQDPEALFLTILAVICAYFGGTILGLIPVAYLTTLKAKR